MKIKYLLVLISCGMLGNSCQKNHVDILDLNVSVPQFTYSAGDTVVFSFSGDANYVTFYSGETGHEYQYKERTELTGGEVLISFESYVQHGSQRRNLEVQLSSDFNGNYNPASISSATWTDITDRFTYATTNTYVGSGEEIVTDLISPGQPFFVAFRYVGQATQTPSQRLWRVANFMLKATYPSNEKILADHVTADWKLVDVANTANKWAYHNNAALSIVSALSFSPNSTLDYSEDWAITGPHNPDKVTPDSGIAIKKYDDNKLVHYEYVYDTPGQYKAVFVAINSNIYGHKEIVKEVTINVQ